MTEYVEVPFAGEAKDRAVLLLAAAEETKQGPEVVRTGIGVFIVPKEVAVQAGLVEGEEKKSGGRQRKASSESETKDKE